MRVVTLRPSQAVGRLRVAHAVAVAASKIPHPIYAPSFTTQATPERVSSGGRSRCRRCPSFAHAAIVRFGVLMWYRCRGPPSRSHRCLETYPHRQAPSTRTHAAMA